MSQKLLDNIYKEALPKVEAMGFDLVDVEFVKEGANWILRFFIDKEPSIDVEDCALVSEMLSDWLDEIDPIDQPYFLEVSSPGIERVLKKEKDFIRFAGEEVLVKLYSPWQGQKEFIGRLGEVDAGELNLVTEDEQTVTIPRSNIARVNLYWRGDKEE